MFKSWKTSPNIALFALLMVTAIWGWTFLVVQDVTAQMPVMDFLAVRFSVAAIFMLAIRPNCLRGMKPAGYARGIILGVLLGLGYILQTFGLQYTSATVSGFITGMSVVITPVILWGVLHRKIAANNWIAISLATLGLGFISLRGWSIGWGELLTLSCAVVLALHIVWLGEWSSQHNIYGLAFLQIATIAVVSLVAAIPGGFNIPHNNSVYMAIGITSVPATALAFVIQTWAQSIVPSTRVALVLTMEPVFAGIFGVLIGGDKLTWQIFLGAILILGAMIIAESKKDNHNPSA